MITYIRPRLPPQAVNKELDKTSDLPRFPSASLSNPRTYSEVSAAITWYQQRVAEARYSMGQSLHSDPHPFFQRLEASEDEEVKSNPFVWQPSKLQTFSNSTSGAKVMSTSKKPAKKEVQEVVPTFNEVLQKEVEEHRQKIEGMEASGVSSIEPKPIDKGGAYKIIAEVSQRRIALADKLAGHLTDRTGKQIRNDVESFWRRNKYTDWLAAASDYLSARYGVRVFRNFDELADRYEADGATNEALLIRLSNLSQGLHIPTVINPDWLAEFANPNVSISSAERFERAMISIAELDQETLVGIVAESVEWMVRVTPVIDKLTAHRDTFSLTSDIFKQKFIFEPEATRFVLESEISALKKTLEDRANEIIQVKGARAIDQQNLRESAGHIAYLKDRVRDANSAYGSVSTEESKKVQQALEAHRACFSTAGTKFDYKGVGFNEPVVREFSTFVWVGNSLIKGEGKLCVIRSLTSEDRKRLEAMRREVRDYKKVTYRDEALADGSGVIRHAVMHGYKANSYENQYRVYGTNNVNWAMSNIHGRTFMSDMITKYGNIVNEIATGAWHLVRKNIKGNLQLVTWNHRAYKAAESISNTVDTAKRRLSHTVKYGHNFAIIRQFARQVDSIVDVLAMPNFKIKQETITTSVPQLVDAEHVWSAEETITAMEDTIPAEDSTMPELSTNEQIDMQMVLTAPVIVPPISILASGDACPEDRLLLIDAALAGNAEDSFTVLLTSNNSMSKYGNKIASAIGTYLEQFDIFEPELYAKVLRGMAKQLSSPEFHAVSMFPYVSLTGDIASRIAYALEGIGMDAMVIKRPSPTSGIVEDYIWEEDKYTALMIQDMAKRTFKQNTTADWTMIHRLVGVKKVKLVNEVAMKQTIASLSMLSIHHRSEYALAQEVLMKELIEEGGLVIDATAKFLTSNDDQNSGKVSGTDNYDSLGLAIAS